jgi:hypothetical protein
MFVIYAIFFFLFLFSKAVMIDVLYDVFDYIHSSVDRLEGELMSELENGRLVRLLTKFGFINERPE